MNDIEDLYDDTQVEEVTDMCLRCREQIPVDMLAGIEQGVYCPVCFHEVLKELEEE